MNSYGALKAELGNDPLSRGYTGMTDAEAASSLNTVNRTGLAKPALLTPSQVLNAIVPADLSALLATTNTTTVNSNMLKLLMLILLLSGNTVDASSGTIRTQAVALFQGSANVDAQSRTTIQRLNALVASMDAPQITRAQEIGWDGPLNSGDVAVARAS